MSCNCRIRIPLSFGTFFGNRQDNTSCCVIMSPALSAVERLRTGLTTAAPRIAHDRRTRVMRHRGAAVVEPVRSRLYGRKRRRHDHRSTTIVWRLPKNVPNKGYLAAVATHSSRRTLRCHRTQHGPPNRLLGRRMFSSRWKRPAQSSDFLFVRACTASGRPSPPR